MAERMIINDVTAQIATNGTSPSMNQLTSPLGPVVHRRLEERAELQTLNNRFASYIETSRALEGENVRLNAALESAKKSNDREKIIMKRFHDDKLAKMSERLKEVTVEKVKLKTEHTRALIENDYLKRESEKLRQQFEQSQENLQNEIAARSELDDTVKRLRQEMDFQKQTHNDEMNETRRQLDTSEINTGSNEQYNVQLHQSLLELRDECEDQIRSNRNELKLLLDGTMRNERNCLQQENKSLSSALQHSSNRNQITYIRIEELEKLNAASNVQISHLESALEEERTRSANSLTELKTLRQEMDLQLTKHQDLMDVNVSQSLELAAFNKVLCNEQQCLKFEPGAKRYRNDIGPIVDRTVTSSSTGNIEIVEVNSAEKFIKLHNKSDNEVVLLSGWILIQQSDGNETVHEFDDTVQVTATADLIVWSADSGVSVSPGNVLAAHKWIVGDEFKITLVNGSGEEEAKRMQKKLSPRNDEIRQPNEEAEMNGQKCVVM